MRNSLVSDEWLLCRARRPAASARLYCIPHSGGSPSEYMRWGDSTQDIEVWGLQLPGRGSRLREEPPTSMAQLIDMLVEQVEFEPPFALFGHSFGALVAFETFRALRGAGRELPVQLFLSACDPPHSPRPDPQVKNLSNQELVAWLTRKYGALPAELRAEPELLDRLLPATRSDLAIYNEYVYGQAPPVEVPVLVMGGERDRITPELLQEWRFHSAGEFTVRMFSGGHFYLREHREQVLSAIEDALAGTLQARALHSTQTLRAGKETRRDKPSDNGFATQQPLTEGRLC